MGVEAVLRKAALGASFTILLVGLALAQTTSPTPAPVNPPAAQPAVPAPATPPANPPAATQAPPAPVTPPAATQANPPAVNPTPNPPAASQANPPGSGSSTAGRNPDPRESEVINYPIAPDVTEREMREMCLKEMGNEYQGWRQRVALSECLEDKRVARSEARQQLRIVRRTGWVDCRREFAEQRMTERERLDAIEGCYAKKDPEFAEMLECRKPLETREPKLGDVAFRREMRECLNDRRRN